MNEPVIAAFGPALGDSAFAKAIGAVRQKVIFSLAELEKRLLAFQNHYERTASPFKWTFTSRDLHILLAKIAIKRLAPAA